MGSRPPRAQSVKVEWVVVRAHGLLARLQAALEAALPGGDRLQGRGAAGGRPQGELALFRSQVIIVIYLSVVGALLLYMAFLMLVDPLIRKPDAYTERLHNEEESEVPGSERGPAGPSAARSVPGA